LTSGFRALGGCRIGTIFERSRCRGVRTYAVCAFFILSSFLSAALLIIHPGAEPAWAATECARSLQAKVDAAPAGGTVRAEPCVYREQLRITKPLTLVGQLGTEIRGSEVWTGWTSLASGNFQSPKSLPRFPQDDVSCEAGTRRCAWPEQVFINGVPQQQVAARSDPAAGQFKVNRSRHVILGTDPAGETVEVTVRRHWITGSPSADGVTIRGFTMRHAANGWRCGAIQSREPSTGSGSRFSSCRSKPDGDDWNVRDNVLLHAHGAVVSVRADRADITGNEIAYGGQLGVHNPGDFSLVADNLIHDNNTERFCVVLRECDGYSTDGNSTVSETLIESGGAKIAGNQVDVIVEDNEIDHNYGNGLWFDVGTHDIVASNNRVHHNARRGIFFEISDGAKIFSNIVYENGSARTNHVNGAGIQVGNSSNAEVYNNTLAWNADGIAVVGVNREGKEHDSVHNVHVHHNIILATASQDKRKNHVALAWLESRSAILSDPTNNNWGANNRYWYPSQEGALERYRWSDKSIQKLADFNTTPGEENGRYLTQDETKVTLTEESLPFAPEHFGEQEVRRALGMPEE
jgi:parallel beta-helix repeat protein